MKCSNRQYPSAHAKALIRFKNFFSGDVVTLFSDNTIDFALQKTYKNLKPSYKKYLSNTMGVDIPQFFNIYQVHGKRVVVATKEGLGNTTVLKRADSAMTCERGIPLIVRTADCVPVFLFDARKPSICLVHVGWRGARKEIITAAVRSMCKKWNLNPRNIKAALGPCIRSCCYQVGDKFRKYFSETIIKKKDKFYLDLPHTVYNQLLNSGIASGKIHDCKICTCCNKRFFSYRRNGEKTGRMASIMMLT